MEQKIGAVMAGAAPLDQLVLLPELALEPKKSHVICLGILASAAC